MQQLVKAKHEWKKIGTLVCILPNHVVRKLVSRAIRFEDLIPIDGMQVLFIQIDRQWRHLVYRNQRRKRRELWWRDQSVRFLFHLSVLYSPWKTQNENWVLAAMQWNDGFWFLAAKFSYESMRTDVLRVYAREEFCFGARDYAVRREICWELNRRGALMKLRRVNENFLRRAASLVITLEGYTLEIFGWEGVRS